MIVSGSAVVSSDDPRSVIALLKNVVIEAIQKRSLDRWAFWVFTSSLFLATTESQFYRFLYTFVYIKCSVVLVNRHDPLLDVLKVRLHIYRPRELPLPKHLFGFIWSFQMQMSFWELQADRTVRFYLHLIIPLLINLIWFD